MFLLFSTIGIMNLREFYITGDGLLSSYEEKVQSYLAEKNIPYKAKEPKTKLIESKFAHSEEAVNSAFKDPRH